MSKYFWRSGGWAKCAWALFVCALLVWASSCSSGSSSGSLSIEIISPAATGLFTTDLPTIGVGGNVGGWTIFDPAPTVSWSNAATAQMGTVAQLLGTFATGQISLLLGDNLITVNASNGKQKQASASILVTRVVPVSLN